MMRPDCTLAALHTALAHAPRLRMPHLAIVAAFAVAPGSAWAQQHESRDQVAEDSLVIKMVHAQIHALDDYARCLERPSLTTPCEPPRPLQLPVRQEPAGGGRASGEALIDSAQRSLRDAEIRAINARTHCLRTRQSRMCGPTL